MGRLVCTAGLAVSYVILASSELTVRTATFEYASWSAPIKAGTCSTNGSALEIRIVDKSGLRNGVIKCVRADRGTTKAYSFPPGTFEIGEQLLIPPNVSITGAAEPNDMRDPSRAPEWAQQTLFLATRGATEYLPSYCHAPDMVTTRVGFVLSSFVTVRNINYQGIDTVRPNDNGALCGGGVFETKGCALNNCASGVNNAGSDGIGSNHVTIDNVRLNDFYFEADRSKIGASVAGNYNCTGNDWAQECCFCKPNGVRSSQVGVWVPQTRNSEGTQGLTVRNIVSRSTQAQPTLVTNAAAGDRTACLRRECREDERKRRIEMAHC